MRNVRLVIVGLVAGILAPLSASAHEVYILPHQTIQNALAAPGFSLWSVVMENLGEFTLWGFIAALVVFCVFFISVSRLAERLLDPFLAKLPPYAPAVSRVTVGVSFIAAAYFGALFGPELPLRDTFGSYAPGVSFLLVIIGLLITLGIYTRTAALIAALLFGAEAAAHGTYMFTYANYAGELVVLGILGAHRAAFHDEESEDLRAPAWLRALKERLAPYAFPILRVAFGTSLIFASLYAKVIHNGLALAVTARYPDVVRFFGFEPHFLVLGAALVEILIGLFFVLGIEIRFTSLFLLFWLSLSLWYFGEVVWPHLILIGIPVAFIFYGYDRYSLEGYFLKRGGREPVL